MAQTKAKKKRQQLIREGKLDPMLLRGSWHGLKPITQIKPNKKKDYRKEEYDRGCPKDILAHTSLSLKELIYDNQTH